jgi:homoprotocatechuate degradation regulator HpaR
LAKTVDDKQDAASLAHFRAFSRSLPMALLKAREDVMAGFRPNLRAHDVTEQQWRALKSLASHGEMRVSHLSQVSLISMPSLTRIIRDLGARSLVQRRSEPGDQRAALVSLTQAGQDLVLLVGQGAESHYDRITASFGGERLEQLQQLLQELSTVLQD